jgi:hypothetical protein
MTPLDFKNLYNLGGSKHNQQISKIDEFQL